ncbi:hypothetical protein Kfla_0819 [Kribbella flavida DSM 17836]|uniref:Uncharacterized protein n=1 Tax=Kribbella flavida (strain DSM 17836 / JCM 10339 / NBRC 14399) TaxID=479435 RepID=D2PYT6_KRIFD|nr:hypothetical protein [Kribbella flavida]ADB29932.1 hypothetical protein Kfla_0819 [Kribbella flavida DSM 17836]
MEYLNPSPASFLPQVMWLTYRTVMERPGLGADDILELLAPAAMRQRTPRGDGVHVQRALDALRHLSLVRSEDGRFTADRVTNAAAFLRVLRHRVVSPPDTFGPEFDAPDDLRRGLIWLLRQSPTKPLDFDLDVRPVTTAFTNDTRWNTFRPWCEVLGFGQVVLGVLAGPGQKQGGGKLIPNPTGAVIDAIREPFGDPLPRDEQIPITQLVAFLRAEIPVLPGHPSATYDGLTGEADEALRALGLALTSAEERQILDMTYQSDPSSVMALHDAHDGRPRYVSTVTIRM